MLSCQREAVTFSAVDAFPFYILRNIQFCLKVCCTKFRKKKNQCCNARVDFRRFEHTYQWF